MKTYPVTTFFWVRSFGFTFPILAFLTCGITLIIARVTRTTAWKALSRATFTPSRRRCCRRYGQQIALPSLIVRNTFALSHSAFHITNHSIAIIVVCWTFLDILQSTDNNGNNVEGLSRAAPCIKKFNSITYPFTLIFVIIFFTNCTAFACIFLLNAFGSAIPFYAFTTVATSHILAKVGRWRACGAWNTLS